MTLKEFDIGGYSVTSHPPSEIVSGWELVQTKTGYDQLMQTYIIKAQTVRFFLDAFWDMSGEVEFPSKSRQ